MEGWKTIKRNYVVKQNNKSVNDNDRVSVENEMSEDYSHSYGERHITCRKDIWPLNRSFILITWSPLYYYFRFITLHIKIKIFYIPQFFFRVHTYVILNRWNFTSPCWTWNVVSFILIYGTFIIIWWMLRWTASIVIFRQCQRYFRFVFYFSAIW